MMELKSGAIMKKTIHEAIGEVLKDADGPLSSRQIYQCICDKELYAFKAKDPANIVRNQLRRHCVNVSGTAGAQTKYFRMTDDGLFALASES